MNVCTTLHGNKFNSQHFSYEHNAEQSCNLVLGTHCSACFPTVPVPRMLPGSGVFRPSEAQRAQIIGKQDNGPGLGKINESVLI